MTADGVYKLLQVYAEKIGALPELPWLTIRSPELMRSRMTEDTSGYV
jgi:hypothetical protein